MVRIKICGITTPQDAALAAELGADFIGLNFHPHSPRYITEGQAKEILSVVPPALEPVALTPHSSFRGVRSVTTTVVPIELPAGAGRVVFKVTARDTAHRRVAAWTVVD